MRLVFNLRDQDPTATKSLGIFNVSMRVLPHLCAHPEVTRVDILANSAVAGLLPRGGSFDRVCHYHFAERPAPRRWARLLWDQWGLVRASDALQPDWVLLPKGFGPLVRWPRARVSAYVHDNLFGYYTARGEKPFPAGEAALFRSGLARTARKADLVVTNSNFTREEFIRDFHPRGQVVRIGAPLPPQSPPPAGAAPDVALLVPLGPWPHKLAAQAIAWLQRWEDETGSRRIVYGVGALPAGCTWPARGHWRYHARLDEGKFQELQATCTLVYFSAYEGFGLPPVETAALGRRVVASDLPPLRETMPPEVLFDNRDYASFARTLDLALERGPIAPLQADMGQAVADRWIAALRSGVNLPGLGAAQSGIVSPSALRNRDRP